MTKEDLDIKSKLDSIAWTVSRINRDTANTAHFDITKHGYIVNFYESEISTFLCVIPFDEFGDPRTIQKLTDCEKRLLFELRRSNQNTRRTI